MSIKGALETLHIIPTDEVQLAQVKAAEQNAQNLADQAKINNKLADEKIGYVDGLNYQAKDNIFKAELAKAEAADAVKKLQDQKDAIEDALKAQAKDVEAQKSANEQVLNKIQDEKSALDQAAEHNQSILEDVTSKTNELNAAASKPVDQLVVYTHHTDGSNPLVVPHFEHVSDATSELL